MYVSMYTLFGSGVHADGQTIRRFSPREMSRMTTHKGESMRQKSGGRCCTTLDDVEGPTCSPLSFFRSRCWMSVIVFDWPSSCPSKFKLPA